jgi:hypothetical protein
MMDVDRDPVRIMDYITDRLSDDEHQAFGERLLHEPDLVRELERTLQLREGLHQLQARGYFSETTAVPAGRRHSWLPALAAVAVLAAIAVGLRVHQSGEPPIRSGTSLLRASTAGATAGTTRFTFMPTRGAAAPVLDLPVTGIIEFRVATGSSRVRAAYEVTLLGEDGRPLDALPGMAPDSDGFLYFEADASRLQAERYVLVAQPNDPRVPAERFPFTFRDSGLSPAR